MTARHAVSARFEPQEDSAPAARRFVCDTLLAWGFDSILDRAALAVSELATNVVLHAHSPFEVTISHTDGKVRVGVRDGLPRPAFTGHTILAMVDESAGAGSDGLFGRGLVIVAAVADAVGEVIEDDGKIVWFELAAGRAEDGHRATLVQHDDSTSPGRRATPARLTAVPVRIAAAFFDHVHSLSRELRLAGDERAAADLGLFERHDGLAELVDRVWVAANRGDDRVDVAVRVADDAGAELAPFASALAAARRLCASSEVLVTPARPEVTHFGLWLVEQLERHLAGKEVEQWTG